MANVEGRATAITVLTPYKPAGRLLLPIVFWVGRNVTATLKKLQMLSFIHYARWVVVKRFPDGEGGEKLHYPYLMFESNFNGSWDQYIDAFSEVVPVAHEGHLGHVLRLPGPDPGRAVQGLHPRQRVRRQPLLQRLSRLDDDRDHLGRQGESRRSTTCAPARRRSTRPRSRPPTRTC